MKGLDKVIKRLGRGVNEGEVGEGGIWRGRRFTGGHSTGDGGLILRALGFCREVWSFGVGIVSVRHRGCWRFWARGPRYPYDILELGSYLVGRVELGFGQCLQSATTVKKESGQTKGY
jgi:hypothetical protein